jgi:pSer/pThr/pTyr-binding forkhead associated (FHA) protein
MAEQLLRVRVSLKGRPVKAHAFAKDTITVGRDPGSDIFLDNPGVSREHCRITLHPSGSYVIMDQNSANGVYVNDQQVRTHYIRNNDVVHVGKFALWFTYDEDRRGEQADARRLATTQDEGTTVLRTTELQEMIETLREAEANAPPPSTPGEVLAVSAAATRRTRSLVVLVVLLAFAGGYAAGGGLRWIPWQKALWPLAGATTANRP